MRTVLLACLCACLLLAVGAAPAAAQGPAKPGPEHEMLKKFEGQWDAAVSFTGGESKATATYKLGLGGFWLLLNFKGEFGGAPFEGRGVMGYDPNKKKYVSTWIDSGEPFLTMTEGRFDKEGKTFTETGESVGMDGKPQKIKSVYEFKDKDSFVFTMYKVADGKDEQLLKITYTRKKK
jgi:hypothetical protein